MESYLKLKYKIPPFVQLSKNFINLFNKNKESLTICLNAPLGYEDLFLVIDIYSFSFHVHPHGHLGWWIYPGNISNRNKVKINFYRENGQINISFPNTKLPIKKWINPNFMKSTEAVYSVHIVLRNVKNESIEFEDVILLFLEKSAFEQIISKQKNLCNNIEYLKDTQQRWFVLNSDTSIHIISHDIRVNDAIGNFCLDLFNFLKMNNFKPFLYAINFDPSFRGIINHIANLNSTIKERDLIFYIFSIFDPFFEFIGHFPCKKIIFFQNITPPKLIRVFDAEYSIFCQKAYEQLALLKKFDLWTANSSFSLTVLKDFLFLFDKKDFLNPISFLNNIFDEKKISSFNLRSFFSKEFLESFQLSNKKSSLYEDENEIFLAEMNSILIKNNLYEPSLESNFHLRDSTIIKNRKKINILTRIEANRYILEDIYPRQIRKYYIENDKLLSFPPLIAPKKWDFIQKENFDLPNKENILLFVGRIAPHKKIEDLFSIFDCFHNKNSNSCLVIVGSSTFKGYWNYIKYLLRSNFQHLKENVYFYKEINNSQLKTIYEASRLFITMSEHEGFCVPIIEAMYFQKPIFAFAQPAIRETLGESGYLFYEKDFRFIANEINRVLNDPQEYQKIINSQNIRFKEICEHANGKKILEAIERVIYY